MWLRPALLLFLTCVSTHASPQIIAHRGNSQAAPENTLASIVAASGHADLSEMDVRVTKDGELVLMHNATINKTTDGRGAVARKDLAELQTLDAGSWFSPEFSNEYVPALSEAIGAAFENGLQPVIERKTGSAEQFHTAFTQANLSPTEFRIISFNQNFISELNELNPDYQLGILGGGGLTTRRLERLANKGADFLSWHHGGIRRSETIDLVHASNMELFVWTVNHPTRMQQLIDLGVDGITTDDPELLRSMVAPNRFANAASSAVITVPEPESDMVVLLLIGIGTTLRRRARSVRSS